MTKTDVTLRTDYAECPAYNMPGLPIHLVRSSFNTCPCGKTALHWHEEVELIEVLKGEIDCHVNDSQITLHEGEGLLINARQPHFSCVHHQDQDSFFLMEVDPKCLFKDEELQKKYVSAICDNSEMPWLHFSPSVLWQKSILILMKDMMEAYESEAGPLRMVARLAELWSLLYENTRLLRQGKEEDPEKIIMQNMIGYIQHHYQDPVTLADIAEAGHVSTSKCCQMFAGYDQISPIQYLLEYRLSQSAFLLRNTDARITDVALSSGFNDANYFTRCFHKWAGMTPSAYRKAAA